MNRAPCYAFRVLYLCFAPRAPAYPAPPRYTLALVSIRPSEFREFFCSTPVLARLFALWGRFSASASRVLRCASPRLASMFRPARSQLSRFAALQSRSCFHSAVRVSGSFFALSLFLFVCLRSGGLSRLSPRVLCLRPIFQVGIFYINPLAECVAAICAA